MEFKTKKMPAAGALDIKSCIAKLEYACRTDDVVIKLEPLLKDQNAVSVFGHKGPQIWIDWIESNRKGAGAEALSKLTLAADAENAILRCYVDGDIGGGLFKFYERFGFVRDPAGGEIMERPPLHSLGAITSVNFNQWFGDSKVIDSKGDPLVVYHGTKSNFKIVDFKKVRDIGFHVGTEEQAWFFAKGKNATVMPLFASVKNPLELRDTFDCKVTSAHDTIWQLEQLGVTSKQGAAKLREIAIENFRDKDIGLWKTWESIRNAIIQAGYDGIRYDNGSEREGEGTSWVVFESSQLKSALNNQGAFDPKSADITK